MRSTDLHHSLSPVNIADGRKQAIDEIKEMFTMLSKSPQLHEAFANMPCSQCANMNSEMLCLERVCESMDYFSDWNSHEVVIRKGLAGRVLQSESKILFFENASGFRIIDQPCAHLAQVCRFELCFAICLQSSYARDARYFLEFFIYPNSNDGYPWTYLNFLYSVMKRYLRSFKVATGRDLGEELDFDAIRFVKRDECQLKMVIRGNEMASSENLNKKDRKRVKLDLSHDDLAPHFGRSLIDVAKEFGWSKTTLQKACRNIGIKSWPHKKLKKDPSNVPIQISEQASNLSGS